MEFERVYREKIGESKKTRISNEHDALTRELEELQMEIPSTAKHLRTILAQIQNKQSRLKEIGDASKSIEEQIKEARDVAERFEFYTQAEEQ
jgi:peptidoglycan hydrolase CwlO-like protein